MKPKNIRITILVVTILATLFGQTDVAKSQVVTDGLLSYWTFDKADIAGQTAKDVWGGRDGTIIGDTRVATGTIGDALQFDGAGDYVEFDPSGLPAGNAPRTMSVWVKPEGAGVRSALEWGANANTQRCAILVLANQTIKFCGQNADVASNGTVANSEWHYVTETYDGTTIRIYIDGVLDKEQAMSINTVLVVGRIGANVKAPTEFFNGAIDEVSIYDRALSENEVAQNFTSKTGPVFGTAGVIDPKDGAIDVPREAVLNWTPGKFAATHDVYFGTVFGDVNDAGRSNQRGVLASQGQIATTYDPPGRLDLGQTYFWRIDEVNAPPTSTIFKGDVWSFTVEPVAYPIARENIIATASSTNRADEGPENTINGSGLDDGDLHSSGNTDMWLSNITGPQPTWIQYEFDRVRKLYQMWVWNYNSSTEPVIGYGVKQATIEYSVDGVTWATLGATHEFARGPGVAGYTPNTTVDLGGMAAKYVKITAKSNWGGLVSQFGLSEVRFLYIPVWAREPNPISGAADMGVDVTLGWRSGREAARHDVYLSTDEQAVIDGTAPVTTVTSPSHAPSLDLAGTYYWRIDEVNDAETPTAWQGDIWSLSTQEYLVVEDFESYNDIEAGQEGSNLIYETWADGFGVAANGSTMGYAVPFEPTMETGTVHSGNQSAPLTYNNVGAAFSEVARTLPAQNWTEHGIHTLSLWFFGDPANTPGQLYVKINGVKVNYDGPTSSLALPGWQVRNIDLASAGANLQSVTSLAIGVDGFGATGTLLLDDIRLYGQAAAPIGPGFLNVPRTSVAPIIDGQWDAVSNDVDETRCLITDIVNTTSATPEDANDLSAIFKAMYDDNNFYIFVEVQDSVIDYQFSNWQGDGVEIYFDGDISRGSTYDGVNDNQIRITVDDVALADIDSSLAVDGTTFKVLLTDLGYNIEASFPLARLQISPPPPDNMIGFEVQINDNDASGDRQTMLRWYSDDNNSWQNPSLFGVAWLVSRMVGQ